MKFSFINSARGIAILLVMTLHVSSLINMEDSKKLVQFFFKYGQLGVQFFFIASAYTLCLSADHRKNEQHAVRNFYIRRYFRIAPVYYLGIIIYFLIHYITNNDSAYDFNNISANVLFIHGFIPSANNSIVPGGWSIAAEMIFYLIFPLLHYFLFKGHLLLKVLLISLICFIGVYLFDIQVDNNRFWYYNIVVQLPVFLVGIAYYKYQNHITLKSGYLLFTVFTVITAIFWYYKCFAFVPVISGISFCGMLKILEKTRLNHIVFQKIGKVSYSIYIVHFIFAYHLLPEKKEFIWLIPYLLLTFLLSYFISVLMERYIEKPFIRLGAKLTSS